MLSPAMYARRFLVPIAALAHLCCGGSGTGTDTGPAPDVIVDVPTVPDVAVDEGPSLPDVPADLAIPETLGGDRPAVFHLPSDYTPTKAWPLVMVLHGFGVNGFIQDTYLGISARVNEFGFITVVPDGTMDSQGHQFWNASPYCCNYEGIAVDDVAYLSGLIEEAMSVFHVDTGQIYLVGHSNGGFMSLRMACEVSGLVTAIGSIAGSLSAVEADCTPSQPVSVLLIHGTEDDDIQYGGKQLGDMGYPGAEETLERWRVLNGCKEGPIQGDPLDYDDWIEGTETLPIAWTGCDLGSTVELWKMEGSNHAPTFTDSFRDALLGHLLNSKRDPAAN